MSLCVAAFAAALLAAGCGGSDATLSRAEFIKQGNAICKKSFQKRTTIYKAYVRKHEGPSTGQIIKFITLPTIEEAARGLDALGAPSGDEEQVKAIVVGIKEGVEKAEKSPENFEVPFTDVANLARRYGLATCAEII